MTEKKPDTVAALTEKIRGGYPSEKAEELLRLMDQLVAETRRDQARVDADLMRLMSERSPDTKPPKGGTNSRVVFATAAEMLDPNQMGWSLNLPPHLRSKAGE